MNLYVGNLSKQATEDELQQAFSEYGQVSEVKIIRDRDTGASRGFGFVEMPNGREAKEAIDKLNLTEIAGRSITVSEARPRTDRRRGHGGPRRW